MPIFDKLFCVYENINRYIFLIGTVFIFLLGSLTIIDITGRVAFHRPLLGNLEMSELIMASIVFFCFGYSFTLDAHIRVDLLVTRLPSRIRIPLEVFTSLLVLLFLFIMSWQGARIAFEQSEKHTDILAIPTFPFALLVPIGAVIACLSIIGHLVSGLGSPPEELPPSAKAHIGEEGN
jgi:TRAP-type C4-dicarboxylate transport system permease small subunit